MVKSDSSFIRFPWPLIRIRGCSDPLSFCADGCGNKLHNHFHVWNGLLKIAERRVLNITGPLTLDSRPKASHGHDLPDFLW